MCRPASPNTSAGDEPRATLAGESLVGQSNAVFETGVAVGVAVGPALVGVAVAA
jgi:hypothetical protein